MHRETPSPSSLGQSWPQAEELKQRRSDSQEGTAASTMPVLAPDKAGGRGHSTSVGSKHLRALTQIVFELVHQRNQDFKYQSIPKQQISTWRREIFSIFFFRMP